MALKVKSEVTGMDGLQSNLRKLGRDMFKKEVAPEVDQRSSVYLGKSQDRVSVDSGQLQRNVVIIRAVLKFIGGLPSEVLGGFVFRQLYAAQHHEGIPANGTNFWPGGGQRKYAESVLQENIIDFQRSLGKAVRAALK